MIELPAATAKESAAVTGAAAIAVVTAAATNSGAMNFSEAIMHPVYHFPVNLKHSRAEALSVCGRGGGAAAGSDCAKNI